MSKQPKNKMSDLEECQYKIFNILKEYNCRLMSADEYSNVLIYDEDTYETVSGNVNKGRYY